MVFDHECSVQLPFLSQLLCRRILTRVVVQAPALLRSRQDSVTSKALCTAPAVAVVMRSVKRPSCSWLPALFVSVEEGFPDWKANPVRQVNELIVHECLLQGLSSGHSVI